MALALIRRNHLLTPQADVLLVMIYFVVVFSIMVQDLSMKPLIRRRRGGHQGMARSFSRSPHMS